MKSRLFLVLALLVAFAVYAEDYVAHLAPLIDPAKLATLSPRGANSRVQKCVYWLEVARKAGEKPDKVAGKAVKDGYTNAAAAKLTKDALLRNLDIAGKLGCLAEAGMADLRKGQSPTVQRGPYVGQELSVDHIIPRAIVPELDCVIANLELLPLKLNESKNAKVGDRQVSLAKKLREAKLLSESGWMAVVFATRFKP